MGFPHAFCVEIHPGYQVSGRICKGETMKNADRIAPPAESRKSARKRYVPKLFTVRCLSLTYERNVFSTRNVSIRIIHFKGNRSLLAQISQIFHMC